MAKGYEIREYAKKHGVSDAEALKALSHDKHAEHAASNAEALKTAQEIVDGDRVGIHVREVRLARALLRSEHINVMLRDLVKRLSARSAIDSIPEGCTPTDARVLRDGNFKLAEENHELRRALRFYANGEHYHGLLHWEGPSGDDNWLCPPGEDELMPEHRAEFIANMDEATVEDGSIAAAALSGKWLVVESPEDEPKVVEGEPEWHIEQSARTETRLGVVPDQALPCESHGRAYLINLDGGITCAKCLADFCWFGKTNAAKPTEIAPTTEGLAGMVRNQQDAGADLLRAAHAAAKAEGTPLAEERRSGWRDVATDPPEAWTPEGMAPMFVLGWFPGMDFPRIEAANHVRWWANAEDPIPGAQWMPLPDGPHG